MDEADPRAPWQDSRYREVPRELLPLGESLADTLARVRVFWDETMVPVLAAGKDVIISTHGNSQRALVKLLENIPDVEAANFDVPNGVPLIYQLDADLRVLERHSLNIPPPAASVIL
jgi:2,3-bisphosphoglycerate-dependent phosphoglycerate mutase